MWRWALNSGQVITHADKPYLTRLLILCVFGLDFEWINIRKYMHLELMIKRSQLINLNFFFFTQTAQTSRMKIETINFLILELAEDWKQLLYLNIYSRQFIQSWQFTKREVTQVRLLKYPSNFLKYV